MMLAEDAVLAGELPAARKHLGAMPSCGGAQSDLATATVLSDLARRGEQEADRAALASYLASGAPGRSAVNQLLATVLEARAAVKAKPSVAKPQLLKSIDALETLPDDDENRNKALLFAYQALVFEALDREDFGSALDLLARQRRTRVSGCAFGLTAESGRLGVVVRTVLNRLSGASVPFEGLLSKALNLDEYRSALRGCPEVAVVAEPAFHGQARLLDVDTAWSFREGTFGMDQEPRRFQRHVVISDVEAPAELNLPRLPPWKSTSEVPIHEHLVGGAATPIRTLATIADADLLRSTRTA